MLAIAYFQWSGTQESGGPIGACRLGLFVAVDLSAIKKPTSTIASIWPTGCAVHEGRSVLGAGVAELADSLQAIHWCVYWSLSTREDGS